MEKKEAMKILKDFYDKSALFSIRTALDTIIPELKESEDEKIRKELIQYLKDYPNLPNGNYCRYDFFAWLEKQGEQKFNCDKLETFVKEWRDRYSYPDDIDKFIGFAESVIKWYQQNEQKSTEEYNIRSIGSKNAQGKLGEMIKNLKPVNEVLDQNSAWSEEDEINYNYALAACKYYGEAKGYADTETHQKANNWLKSLKKRVQPQPKQEWSEEDKGNLLDVKCIIDEVWNNQDVREKIGHSDEELESLWHWLDNIWQRVEYPQNTWKPSEEQMDALDSTLQYSQVSHNSFEQLNSLFNDLKKLREE